MARYGVLLESLKSWSGTGGDIFNSVCIAFASCEELGCARCVYDAVGLGSRVRGDARASPGGAAVRLGAAPSGNVRDLGAAGP